MISKIGSKVTIPLRAVSRSAIALLLTATTFQSSPAKATPALAAPAACLTGVGCVLLGTAVIGGAVYYVWQKSNGQQVLTPIVDDENPEGWVVGDTVTVFDRNRCHEIAKQENRRLIDIDVKKDFSGGEYYVCIFE